MLRRIRTAALAFSAAASALALGASEARAQAQLNTDIDIDFPSIIILNCFDRIDVDVTGDQLLAAIGVTGSTNGAATATQTSGAATATNNAGDLEADAGTLAATPGGSVSAVNLNLNGVCAVRAVGTGGVVETSLAINDGALNLNASTITVAAIRGRDGGTTAAGGGGAFTGAFPFDVATAGFGSLSYIDVQLELDLAAVTEAGVHTGSGDTFTVTVAAP